MSLCLLIPRCSAGLWRVRWQLPCRRPRSFHRLYCWFSCRLCDMRSTVRILQVRTLSVPQIFSALLAIAGGLMGLALSWTILRRRLMADGAPPTRLRRLNLISAVLGIAAVGAAFLTRAVSTSESVSLLFITLVVAIGAIILLPKSKLWQSPAAFAIGVALLLVRERVFAYAAKGGVFLEHVIPLLYLTIVLALFVSAMIHLLKNLKLSKF
jgi:hypothetical protein